MRASLNQAMIMAKKAGYVFLTTADGTASPYLSIVQPVGLDNQDRLKLIAWLCPRTLRNLRGNPKVSVVIWDAGQDTGYQLLGVMDDMREIAELDGYAVGLEEKKHFPQVEWRISVRVERILDFQKAPHVDAEV